MKHKGQGSRLQQVIDWLGGPSFDGCIVLDEAHKAKSFVPGKEAQSSKVRVPHCTKPCKISSRMRRRMAASKLDTGAPVTTCKLG